MLINGNALHIPLADKSVQCCVTSPPYWGLRDYGEPDQLGLEQTPEEYVENMVAVFREVWRVLRDDGTLWLNLGDSYATSHSPGTTDDKKGWKHGDISQGYQGRTGGAGIGVLKAKDLVGIPWRIAFALQADGWYLRNDIIWHKPNPMPESVTDRCTKSHEYIFLLTKSAKYYYDNEAVKEPMADYEIERRLREKKQGLTRPPLKLLRDGNTGLADQSLTGAVRNLDKVHDLAEIGTRNKRTVWTITTKPYSGAHYATFPPEIPETCIKAGTSEAGKCPDCGMPFERVKEVVSKPDRDTQEARENMVGVIPGRDGVHRMNSKDMESIVYKDVGWQAQCECGKDPIPCIVLDPFIGSGTTCMVARDLGRDSVGLDLSLDYLVNNAKVRLQLDKLEYWYDRGPEVKGNFEGLPMFTD